MAITTNIVDPRLISLPFSFNQQGAVYTIPDYDPKVYRDKIFTILTTNDYERIWYLHYGSSIQNYLFDPSEAAMADIDAAINEAFVRWAPELTFKKAESSYDMDTGAVTVGITYSLPSGQEDSVKISTADFTAAGELVKVIYNG